MVDTSSRRYILAIMVIWSAIFLLPHRLVAQSADELLKSNVIQRLDQLADYLDNRAGGVSRLSERLSGLQPGDAARSRARIAEIYPQVSGLLSPLQNEPSDALLSGRYGEEVQLQTLVGSLRSGTTELTAYSTYLRQLRDHIAAAPTNETIPLLQASYVPSSVAIIINNGLGTTTPGGDAGLPYSALPGPDDSAGLIPYILGGRATVDYPAVAALLYSDDVGGISPRCTATLIAPNAVLTARHCLDDTVEKVFFQHAGLIDVDTFEVHAPYHFPDGDLAIIFLKKEVADIKPADLNTIAKLATVANGIVVGFGWHDRPIQIASTGSSTLVQKTGVKLFATLKTSQCSPEYGGKSLLCWTYGVNPVGYGSTCFGDSGGPLFSLVQDKWVLAGVTAGGRTCAVGDAPVDVEVFDFVKNWIEPTLKAHPPKSSNLDNVTNRLAPLTNPTGRYLKLLADLLLQQTDGSWSGSFDLKTPASRLVVGLDGVPTGYMLRLEVGPNGKQPICTESDVASSVICELGSPAVGGWHVKVVGQPGQEIQLVVTAF